MCISSKVDLPTSMGANCEEDPMETDASKYSNYLSQLHLDNTHLLCKGNYHCMADLLFDRFGSDQTSKSVVNLP